MQVNYMRIISSTLIMDTQPYQVTSNGELQTFNMQLSTTVKTNGLLFLWWRNFTKSLRVSVVNVSFVVLDKSVKVGYG